MGEYKEPQNGKRLKLDTHAHEDVGILGKGFKIQVGDPKRNRAYGHGKKYNAHAQARLFSSLNKESDERNAAGRGDERVMIEVCVKGKRRYNSGRKHKELPSCYKSHIYQQGRKDENCEGKLILRESAESIKGMEPRVVIYNLGKEALGL